MALKCHAWDCHIFKQGEGRGGADSIGGQVETSDVDLTEFGICIRGRGVDGTEYLRDSE